MALVHPLYHFTVTAGAVIKGKGTKYTDKPVTSLSKGGFYPLFLKRKFTFPSMLPKVFDSTEPFVELKGVNIPRYDQQVPFKATNWRKRCTS